MSSSNQIPALQQRLEMARSKMEVARNALIEDKARLNDTTMTEYANAVPPQAQLSLKQRRTLKGHLGKIMSLAWSADSSKLVSVGQDGKLFLWDAQSTNKLQVIGLQSSWVMNCAYSPSGKFVAAGGLDNLCSVYDLRAADAALSHNPSGTIQPTKTLDAHVGFVSGIKFLNDDQVLTCSGDHTSILWDLTRGSPIRQFHGHTADIMGLALLKDASGSTNTFVTCSGDRNARLWDIRSGSCEAMFTTGEDKSDLLTIDAFPNSQAFATGGEDGVIRLFDIRAQTQISSYIPPDQAAIARKEDRKSVTSISFTHSGRVIAAGYEDEQLRLWDTFRGDRVGMLKAHEERVTCVAVSPDGTGLASGSWDKIIKIWA